ncbi:MAG: hypothetical protein ACRDIB_19610, partial [Ardenticatenaceae bacterium]
VILCETPFAARLRFTKPSEAAGRLDELAFLAACVKAFRRAGSSKTRGYGRLRADLHTEPDSPPITNEHFRRFREAFQS